MSEPRYEYHATFGAKMLIQTPFKDIELVPISEAVAMILEESVREFGVN